MFENIGWIVEAKIKDGHFSYQLSVISYQLSVPPALVGGLKY
ncbi:hypothetical protein [Okeania sp. SIO2B3]|nr:hypothetical protein [Okeania sp. SIO2B3]